jgi:hypothetical protein
MTGPFRFKDVTRFVRKPDMRSSATTDTLEVKPERPLYNIVHGHIDKVAFEKNGIPYIGGAR